MLEEYKIINIHNFRKLGMIGKGDSSNVFRIQDKNSGKLYAFKIFLEISEEDDQKLEISKEASVYSRVSHPCITRCHGLSPIDFDDEPMLGVVLDYYKNGSLDKIVENMRKGLATPGWNNTKMLITLYGVAAGAAYMHSKSIILRDLKTGNILLDDNFYPKLTNFGLSTFFDQKSQNTHSYGNPLFMAPEVMDSEDYTTSADVYSYSMIVFF